MARRARPNGWARHNRRHKLRLPVRMHHQDASSSVVEFGRFGVEEATMASNDLAARLMGDMAPQLLEFLKTKVNSFVKWDLVRFFHENPNTTDTAENIARYAGRDVATIEVELDELVGTGVLDRQHIGDLIVYSLAEDPAMRSLVDQFILACDDRQFRVKAIYHIIRGMR
jgi:hypothetical protein